MTRTKTNYTNQTLSMKATLFLITMLLAALVKAQQIDVLHYQFAINLNDQNDTIRCTASIKFIHLTDNPIVAFDLTNVKASGKGMKVGSVGFPSFDAPVLPLSHENDKLTIKFLSSKKGDTQILNISYQGVPDDGLIISKNKYGDRTFFADNWPNRAHHWLPCNDRPDDKASFEFAVSAPSNYQVVSNGLKWEERLLSNGLKASFWKEDISLPTKVMAIGVAKFATKVFADSPKDMPVSAWVYPQDSAKGFYDYAVTTDIVKFFSSYIAPFPYKKLANVQSKTIFGGMENASCIFYAESSVTGDRSEEDLYAHEIAHQWFGDMASEKSFAHLWLSEGFATYMTDIYFEHKYGKEAFNKRLQKERDEAIAFAKTYTHPVVDSTPDLMSLLNANSYQKGAWVLHMLRQEVGDSAFHKIIQTYYNTYKGGNADTRDFEAAAEKVSGRDLRWFFDQWLYRPSVPQVIIKPNFIGRKLNLVVQQIQDTLYQFPLEIEFLKKDNTSETIKVLVKKREQYIVVPSINAFEPIQGMIDGFNINLKRTSAINVDPKSKLLLDWKMVFPK